MPRTRSRGKPDASSATWHIASSGLVTTMRIASGECADGLLDDRRDDPGVLRQQVVAAHARLAGEAGGHDDDVRARRVGVVVRAGDPGVVADDRRRLGEVEALALRQPLDDVDEHDVGEAGLGDALGGRRADVAGADDGDLVAGHGGGCSFRDRGWVLIVGTMGRRSGGCPDRGGIVVRRWSADGRRPMGDDAVVAASSWAGHPPPLPHRSHSMSTPALILVGLVIVLARRSRWPSAWDRS